jgi:sorbose reductase
MAPPLENVKPMFDLYGRNYIVTGGAQGIGFASTRAICEMGGNVAVLDIQASPVPEFNSLASEFGVKTFYVQTDVTKQDSLEKAFEKAISCLDERLDGLIPAAGIAIDKRFVDQTWEEFSRIQDINVSVDEDSYFSVPRFQSTDTRYSG